MKKYTAPEMEIKIFADCIKTDGTATQPGNTASTYSVNLLNQYAFEDQNVKAQRITTVRNIVTFN